MELLDLIPHLDWFERLDELLRFICGDESWRFCVPRSCGLSGREIEQLLQRHGVMIWGRNFSRDHLFFRVKLNQANWAEYLLWRRGIPADSRPFNTKNQSYGRRHYPGTEPPITYSHTNPRGWWGYLRSLFL